MTSFEATYTGAYNAGLQIFKLLAKPSFENFFRHDECKELGVS